MACRADVQDSGLAGRSDTGRDGAHQHDGTVDVIPGTEQGDEDDVAGGAQLPDPGRPPACHGRPV